MLRVISQNLVSFVFPLSCELCGHVLPARNRGAVCHSCEGSFSLIEQPWTENEHFHFDRVYAACFYEDKIKKLLVTFKFRRRRSLGPSLIRLVERKMAGQDPSRWDAVVSAPMSLAKKLERGYNQAELLARGCAGFLQKPFLGNVLTLTGTPRQQSKLSKSQRRENVHHLFQAKGDFSGKKLLLVDDVLTTGETASECSRALKEAGAKIVDVLVVARGR